MRFRFCRSTIPRIPATLICFLFAVPLCAQAGPAVETTAWLRYAPLDSKAAMNYENLPAASVLLGKSPVLENAQRELAIGVEKMLGHTLKSSGGINGRAIVLGTIRDLHSVAPALEPPRPLEADGYWLTVAQIRHAECFVITAPNDRGVLYGVFALLSKIGRGESITAINEVQNPYAPIRWINQWDNLDGRIERGYGGPSDLFRRWKSTQRSDAHG